MVDIQSKEVIDKISDNLKVQPSMMIPRALAKDIQLTYDVNPTRVIDLVRIGSAVDSASATVHTASTEKDTFITGFCLTMIKDVSAVSAATDLRVIIGGATRQIAIITGLTLTVQNETITGNFAMPIKIDRGSAITLTHSNATASVKGSAIIYGYETDPQ